VATLDPQLPIVRAGTRFEILVLHLCCHVIAITS
jgi:hypothetical protein